MTEHPPVKRLKASYLQRVYHELIPLIAESTISHVENFRVREKTDADFIQAAGILEGLIRKQFPQFRLIVEPHHNAVKVPKVKGMSASELNDYLQRAEQKVAPKPDKASLHDAAAADALEVFMAAANGKTAAAKGVMRLLDLIDKGFTSPTGAVKLRNIDQGLRDAGQAFGAFVRSRFKDFKLRFNKVQMKVEFTFPKGMTAKVYLKWLGQQSQEWEAREAAQKPVKPKAPPAKPSNPKVKPKPIKVPVKPATPVTPKPVINNEVSYTVREARYAKGQLSVKCESRGDGWKSRAMNLCEGFGGRYTHRSNAYIMSPAAVKKMEAAFQAGYDFSPISREFKDAQGKVITKEQAGKPQPSTTLKPSAADVIDPSNEVYNDKAEKEGYKKRHGKYGVSVWVKGPTGTPRKEIYVIFKRDDNGKEIYRALSPFTGTLSDLYAQFDKTLLKRDANVINAYDHRTATEADTKAALAVRDKLRKLIDPAPVQPATFDETVAPTPAPAPVPVNTTPVANPSAAEVVVNARATYEGKLLMVVSDAWKKAQHKNPGATKSSAYAFKAGFVDALTGKPKPEAPQSAKPNSVRTTASIDHAWRKEGWRAFYASLKTAAGKDLQAAYQKYRSLADFQNAATPTVAAKPVKPAPVKPLDAALKQSGLLWLKERAAELTKLSDATRMFQVLDLEAARKLQAELEMDWRRAIDITRLNGGVDDDSKPNEGRPYSGVIDAAVSRVNDRIKFLERIGKGSVKPYPEINPVMIEPDRGNGLDRRVFRKYGDGYEWAHFSDWQENGTRARFYGWSSKELPPSLLTKPAEILPEQHAHLTDNERKVLRAMYANNYGSYPGDQLWADCINDSQEPSGIEGKSLSGVLASLNKKGYVNSYGSGRDAGVNLTAKGMEAAEALDPKRRGRS